MPATLAQKYSDKQTLELIAQLVLTNFYTQISVRDTVSNDKVERDEASHST